MFPEQETFLVDCTKTHFCRIAFAQNWRLLCANALMCTHPHTWTRLVVCSYYESLISRGGGTVILRVGIIARGTVLATFIDFIAVNSAIATGIIAFLVITAFVDFIAINSAIAIVVITNFVIAVFVDFIVVNSAITIIIITDYVVAAFVDFIAVDYIVTIIIITNFSI